MSYDYLSLPAQLNVDADAAAGDFQDQHGSDCPQVLMFPHAGTQFQINHGTVTHHYKSSIRYAAHGPPLLEYIQQRNSWSIATVQYIDWHAHKLAINQRIHLRVHLTKLIHDILPTNDNASRWTPKRTEKCPSCPFTFEDRDHVLRCPHSARCKWRWTFLISVRKTCDTLTTRPHLQDILLQGLDAWLTDEPADFSRYPPVYSALLHQQHLIGWRQMFNGRLSLEWSRLQDEYLHEQGTYSKKNNGLLWSTHIVTNIWDEWHILWTTRNQVIHGHDQVSRRIIQRQDVEDDVRTIYEDRELLLPADQDHLYPDLASHLQNSTTSLRNWVTTYGPMFSDSIAKAKRRAVLGVRSIRTYFAPT